MMRKKALIVTLSFLTLGTVFFTSCEKESIQSELLDESKIGESILRVQYNDTLIIRKGITGNLNGKGEFNFKFDVLGEDNMSIQTLAFEEGTYPANINIAKYFFSELGEFGSSFDITRPQYQTGFIKINRINKLARAIDGEFKIKIFPPFENELNIRPFEISGNFVNLRYERTEAQYFDAMINGEAFKSNSLEALELKDDLVIKAHNSVSNESIEIKFNKELEVGQYGAASVEGSYTSPLGVVYTTSKDLNKSSLLIRKFTTSEISASFTLQLKSKQGDVIEVKAGDLKTTY